MDEPRLVQLCDVVLQLPDGCSHSILAPSVAQSAMAGRRRRRGAESRLLSDSLMCFDRIYRINRTG